MGRYETKQEADLALPPELSAELKKMNDQVKSALQALDSKAVDTQKNAEKFLLKYEEEAAKFNKQLKAHEDAKEAAEAKAAKLEGRLSDVEHQLAGKGSQTSETKTADQLREEPEYKNFFEYLKKGRAFLGAEELKTLRTDKDVTAGFLLPQVMDAELRKNITETSPIRAFARIRPMASKTMDISRRLKIGRATYEGEAGPASESESKYGREQVTVYRMTAYTEATEDMLMWSAFDLEGEIMGDIQEQFALGEGYSMLFGTGEKSPKGVLADTRCEVVDTAGVGVLAFEDFATIAGKLKKGQRPWFFMNRKTLAEIWKLKGSDGHPIWAPVAFGGQTAATIFGYPYNSDFIDLDSHVPTTTLTKPIIFGDLKRGYEIFDASGTVVVRDDLTKADQAITKWTFRRYNTGQVIIPEAIKILRVKA